MAKVIFIESDGTRHTVDAANGRTVMQAAVENHVPGIIGDCGGCCGCGTCHGYVDADWLDKLKPKTSDEAAMLEAVTVLQANSRLTCQIEVQPELDGLIVRLPEQQF